MYNVICKHTDNRLSIQCLILSTTPCVLYTDLSKGKGGNKYKSIWLECKPWWDISWSKLEKTSLIDNITYLWRRKLEKALTQCIKFVGFWPKIFNASKNPLLFSVHLQSIYHVCLGIMILSKWCSVPSGDEIDTPCLWAFNSSFTSGSF